MDIKRLEGETDFELIKRLVNDKLINKTIDTPYEDLSELLFGEGNCFNESEVRKRMYGMKRLFEVMEQEPNHVATRILSVSDAHVPFNESITIFQDYVGKTDILVLNGDIIDQQQISRFSKSYRVSVMEELILGRQYIIDLIEYIKPKKVVIIDGNHEKRFGAYFAKNLDSDILELMPDSAMDLIIESGFNHYNKRDKTKIWYEPLKNVFEDIEIEYTGDWYCMIGNSIFCHPQAYSTGMLKTTEKAVNFFLRKNREFDTIVMSHVHKLGSYIQGNIYMFEQGCCCDVDKLDYANGKLYYPQQKGFIYLCQASDGSLIYDKTKLVELK